MEIEFDEIISNLIREYCAWKRELKRDIDKYDDDMSKEQKGSYDALVIVISDLKKIRKRYGGRKNAQ